MKRYLIKYDRVKYGGPASFYPSILKSNLTFMEAVTYIKERIPVEEALKLDLFVVVQTKPDSMGCYTRYMFQEDTTAKTYFQNLSETELEQIKEQVKEEIIQVKHKIQLFTFKEYGIYDHNKNSLIKLR